jgi:hypothetical protein
MNEIAVECGDGVKNDDKERIEINQKHKKDAV